jgi:mannosyltransferase
MNKHKAFHVVKSLPAKYYIYLIFFINFGFKFINLTAEPVWYDECFSIFYSQQPFSNILDVSKWEPPPPLFNLILHCWIKLFGVSEFGVRLFPAMCSSLAGVYQKHSHGRH